MLLLTDKVVLVTGAGKGIGRAYALELAAQGAHVVVNDVDAQAADEVVHLIVDSGAPSAIADYSDISTWTGSSDAVAAGIEHFGQLDGLVNNAGVLRRADLADLCEADVELEVAVNLAGTLSCSHHASSFWRDQHRAGQTPRAAVVNSTSDVIFTGSPGGIGYGTTKSAIVGLTQTASLEGAHYGVRHNAVAPSGLTAMAAGSGLLTTGDGAPPPELQDIDSPVNPRHNAPLVVWLLSDRSLHVSGQVFRLRFGAIARMSPVATEQWQLPDADGPRWSYDGLEAAVDGRVHRSKFPLPVREYPDGTSEPFARLDHG